MARGLATWAILVACVHVTTLSGADFGDDLRKAAHNGDIRQMEQLLADGGDVDAHPENGRTALIEAAREGRKAALDFLLKQGANIDWKDGDGFTALMHAVSKGETEIVEFLLDAGANPNIADEEGATPLIMSARKDRIDITRALLSHGADLNARDHTRSDALTYACAERFSEFDPFTGRKWKDGQLKHLELVKVLVEAGADPRNSKLYLDPSYLPVLKKYDFEKMVSLGATVPKTVIVFPVTDDRSAENKKKSPNLGNELEEAFRKVLKSRNYQVIAFTPEAEDESPDYSATCREKGADAFLETELFASRAKNWVVMRSSDLILMSSLVNCTTGRILWHVADVVSEERGWIVAIGVSGAENISDILIGQMLPRRPHDRK